MNKNKATLAQGRALIERLLEANASVEEVQALLARFGLIKLMLKADLSRVDMSEFREFLFGKSCSLEEARQIPNLVVIGPKEISDLFGVSLKLIPSPSLAVTREQLEVKITERGNELGLILRLREIGWYGSSLLFLNGQFGEKGKIKKGLLRSEQWYIRGKGSVFAGRPVCQVRAEWVLADLELPGWSICKNYDEQKKEVAKRELRLKTAPSDAFDLLLIAAVTGRRYRKATCGRTDAYYLYPISVGPFGSSGLRITYTPEDRCSNNGLSCEEVVS